MTMVITHTCKAQWTDIASGSVMRRARPYMNPVHHKYSHVPGRVALAGDLPEVEADRERPPQTETYCRNWPRPTRLRMISAIFIYKAAKPAPQGPARSEFVKRPQRPRLQDMAVSGSTLEATNRFTDKVKPLTIPVRPASSRLCSTTCHSILRFLV